jgi:hypothetical protein
MIVRLKISLEKVYASTTNSLQFLKINYCIISLFNVMCKVVKLDLNIETWKALN